MKVFVSSNAFNKHKMFKIKNKRFIYNQRGL